MDLALLWGSYVGFYFDFVKYVNRSCSNVAFVWSHVETMYRVCAWRCSFSVFP